ncbi:hypothetical protein Tco_0720925 [Tanacetum coccineum]
MSSVFFNLRDEFSEVHSVQIRILPVFDNVMQQIIESAIYSSQGMFSNRFSQAAAALHEFKFICSGLEGYIFILSVEEAKLLLRSRSDEMAKLILKKFISQKIANWKEEAQIAIPSAIFFQPPIGQVGLGERRVTGTAVPAITMIFFGDVQDR